MVGEVGVERSAYFPGRVKDLRVNDTRIRRCVYTPDLCFLLVDKSLEPLRFRAHVEVKRAVDTGVSIGLVMADLKIRLSNAVGRTPLYREICTKVLSR